MRLDSRNSRNYSHTRGYTCGAPGCSTVGYAKGLCSMHYQRVQKGGSLPPEVPARPGLPNHWKGADIGYGGAHDRVRNERGSASAHSCVDCGEQAAHWSYDGTDPDEKTGPRGRYSSDPQRYQSRCVPCHSAFDRVS